jgi:4-diphosphocytidyl-2-C-methyl-D-erythritol kinase
LPLLNDVPASLRRGASHPAHRRLQSSHRNNIEGALVLTIESPAKINWLLHIGRRRDDGFHELETLFQTISLSDTIVLEPSDRYRLETDDPAIPAGEENLITRAWRALGRLAEVPPVRISVRKRIPAGGGLAGGSSNAASTLLGLRRMFELDVSDEQLHDIALQLGSDVPFFLVGGLAWATGRGEHLTPLEPLVDLPLLLVLPPTAVSTPAAFSRLAEMRAADEVGISPFIGLDRSREALAALARGDSTLMESLRNDLEPPVFQLEPQLAEIRQRLYDAGASFARMSGSGSTLFGLFSSRELRERAATELARSFRVARTSASG